MLLRDDQTYNIHRLVTSLYSHTLTADRLLQLSPLICSITDSQYFALILFPGVNVPEYLYISNNPEDFNTIYQEVQGLDFLLHLMVEKAQPIQFSLANRESIPNKEDFLVDLNKVRPTSDCVYVPILLQDRISGFIGIAKGGKSPYNNNEVEIIKFVSSFITESISSTLMLPEIEHMEVLLDRNGCVLKYDDYAKELFISLFGDHYWESPLWGESEFALDFKKAWERFMSPIYIPGDSTMEFEQQNKSFRLEFKYENNIFLEPYVKDAPYVKIKIKEGRPPFIIHKTRFDLSPREQEVVDCIYRGFSSKEISELLGISISTVKKHIWNIFNKVGVDNRTSLIFALSQ